MNQKRQNYFINLSILIYAVRQFGYDIGYLVCASGSAGIHLVHRKFVLPTVYEQLVRFNGFSTCTRHVDQLKTITG